MLTDGQLANDREVLAITRSLDPACRLFVLGIGMAPSDALLSRLARMGGGTYLTANGPLWKQCMSILEPVRGTRGWKGLVSAANRGDIRAAVRAADMLNHGSGVNS